MIDSSKPTYLKFELVTKNLAFNAMPMVLLNKLNETEWMGKEAKSCKIKDFKQRKPVSVGQEATFDIVVEYKPKGCITFNRGGFWYDGWRLKHIDVKRDGTLLDGNGQPLPAGEDPVVLGWNVYETAEFNEYDFGKFIAEEECEDTEGL